MDVNTAGGGRWVDTAVPGGGGGKTGRPRALRATAVHRRGRARIPLVRRPAGAARMRRRRRPHDPAQGAEEEAAWRRCGWTVAVGAR